MSVSLPLGARFNQAAQRRLRSTRTTPERFTGRSKGDQRRREAKTVGSLADAEPLLALPAAASPAILEVERIVDRQAMVAFEGNRYSTDPELLGQAVTVRARLGELGVEIRSASGAVAARHRRAPSGAGQAIRATADDKALLSEARVLIHDGGEGIRRQLRAAGREVEWSVGQIGPLDDPLTPEEAETRFRKAHGASSVDG